MTRAASAAFLSALAAGHAKLAHLIDITTPDGLVHRWTTWGKPLSDGTNTYDTRQAAELIESIDTPSDGSPSSTQLTLSLATGYISRADLMVGRYQGAAVTIREKLIDVDGADGVMTTPLFHGFVAGDIDLDAAKRGVVRVEGMLRKARGSRTFVMQTSCMAEFGRTSGLPPFRRCPFPIDAHTYPATVDSVAGGAITVTYTGTPPADLFDLGVANFTSGAAQYHQPGFLIFDHDGTTLKLAMPGLWGIAIGDTLLAKPGCDLTLARCKVHSALVNDPDVFSSADYKGFPFIIGEDRVAGGF